MSSGRNKDFNFGIPQGSTKWGNLLFEPRWSKKEKFHYSIFFGDSIGLIAGGILFLLILIALILQSRKNIFLYIFVFLCFITSILFGLLLFSSYVREMPFRIYEKGITNPRITLLNGIYRREEIILYNQIQSIKIVKNNNNLINNNKREIQIIINYINEKKIDSTIIIDNTKIENLEGAYNLLKAVIDEKYLKIKARFEAGHLHGPF